MRYLLTTIPGFEDVARQDIGTPKHSFEPLPKKVQGRLILRGELPSHLPKSVLSAYKIFYSGQRLEEKEIAKRCKKQKVRKGWLLIKDVPRGKEHFDTKRDRLAKQIGMQLERSDGRVLRVDTLFDQTILSLHEKDSTYREYRKDTMSFSLKPPFGYCMVRLTDLAERQTLLDPFCGGGTIPIEAAQWYGHTISIIASDMTATHVNASIRNAKEAKVRQMIHFMEADVGKLQQNLGQYAHAIVTEFPHQLKPRTMRYLFRAFFDMADSTLVQNGTIIALLRDGKEFRKLSEGYSILEERKTIKGGYPLRLFILKKC